MRAVALVAAVLCVVGGCAVPGKGDPGVAATYRDRVITEDDIASIHSGFEDLSTEVDVGEDLTLLLIGPAVIEAAERRGFSLTDDEATTAANLWVSFLQGTWVEPTTEVKEIVREVKAIAFLMDIPSGTGLEALEDVVKEVEANTVANPRYGDFTLVNFLGSLDSIYQYIDQNQADLGSSAFIMFKDVNGFSVAYDPDWISGG